MTSLIKWVFDIYKSYKLLFLTEKISKVLNYLFMTFSHVQPLFALNRWICRTYLPILTILLFRTISYFMTSFCPHNRNTFHQCIDIQGWCFDCKVACCVHWLSHTDERTEFCSPKWCDAEIFALVPVYFFCASPPWLKINNNCQKSSSWKFHSFLNYIKENKNNELNVQ